MGWMLRCYEPQCEICGDWDNHGNPLTKKKAISLAIESGWKFPKPNKPICPKCVKDKK